MFGRIFVPLYKTTQCQRYETLALGFLLKAQAAFSGSQKKTPFRRLFLEVPPRIELGIRELQSHALPLGYGTKYGAADEARTRYLHLGKVALYQMSYSRILWCLRAESLFCGKATAVKICHRHIFKSRLSIPYIGERIFD